MILRKAYNSVGSPWTVLYLKLLFAHKKRLRKDLEATRRTEVGQEPRYICMLISKEYPLGS